MGAAVTSEFAPSLDVEEVEVVEGGMMRRWETVLQLEYGGRKYSGEPMKAE